ncbi:hypothetical protein Mapa_000486 [Marchantia paleacea]|nr:hypothetical protein Mapa_000486 [Marchantia paleacea]
MCMYKDDSPKKDGEECKENYNDYKRSQKHKATSPWSVNPKKASLAFGVLNLIQSAMYVGPVGRRGGRNVQPITHAVPLFGYFFRAAKLVQNYTLIYQQTDIMHAVEQAAHQNQVRPHVPSRTNSVVLDLLVQGKVSEY